jgi:[ribosomal protein S5]-alanine N-acetyltransferase
VYPVRLVGPRVTLREFVVDDVDQVLALVGDDQVTRWLSFDSRSRRQAVDMVAGIVERAQLNPRTEYYLAVTVADATNIIGFVRLGLDGAQAAKLGYAIRADHWGHGYATSAARAMLDFGFDSLSLHRISAAIGPDNAASIGVVEHLGFHYEGRIRDHVFTNGAWRDSLLYSTLADEWAVQQPH